MNAGGETMPWCDVRLWRRARREELLALRSARPRTARQASDAALRATVAREFPELERAVLGFYWPFKGEPDLRPLVLDLLMLGASAALPVVTAKGSPVEFWAWHPGMKLQRGVWDIPIPALRKPVVPTALLVPLVGFDRDGYRLGYGGGYYDRTLATMSSKPLTIGVGLELGRLATIHPQPHDVPLDAIVTEVACVKLRHRGRPLDCAAARREDKLDDALKATFPARDPFSVADEPSYASPPCFLRDVDPAYMGYLGIGETVSALNRLLTGSRGRAQAASELALQYGSGLVGATLAGIARDEARICAMLTRHIVERGGAPAAAPGAPYAAAMRPHNLAARLDVLRRDQTRASAQIRELLPGLFDAALRDDLAAMADTLARNARYCRLGDQTTIDPEAAL